MLSVKIILTTIVFSASAWFIIRASRAKDGAGWGLTALALAIAAFIPTACGGWFSYLIESDDPCVPALLAAYLLPAGISFLAFVLGATAFFKYKKGVPFRRKWPPFTAFILNFFFLLNLIAGAAFCISDYSSNAIPSKYKTNDKSPHFKNENLNFEVNVPDGWLPLNPTEVDSDAAFAMGKSFPQTYCVIIANKKGAGASPDTSLLTSSAKQRLIDELPGITTSSLPSVPMQGSSAMAFLAKNRRKTYRCLCLSKNGFQYQIKTWTDTKNASNLENDAETAWKAFKILDKNLLSPAPGGHSVSHFESEEIGFSIDFPDDDWATWGDQDAKNNPDSSLGAIHLPSTGVFFVEAFLLPKTDLPSDDALVRAFLSEGLKVDYTKVKFKKKSPIKKNGFNGVKLEFDWTKNNGKTTSHSLEIFKGKNRAYMACAAISDNVDKEIKNAFLNKAEQLLDSFKISEGDVLWDDLSMLPSPLRHANGIFLNQIGLFHYYAKSYKRALIFFENATAANPEDLNILTNTLTVLDRMGKSEKGLELINSNHTKTAEDPSVLSWKGWFLHKLHRHSDATEVYEKLFQNGYRGDDDFGAYIDSLVKLGKWNTIVDAAKKYDANAQGYDQAISSVEKLLKNGRANEALEILDAIEKNRAMDPDAVFYRMDALEVLGDNQTILKLCRKLLDDKLDSALLRHYQGDAMMAMKNYPEAEKAYRKSFEMDPKNKSVEKKLLKVLKILEKRAPSAEKKETQ